MACTIPPIRSHPCSRSAGASASSSSCDVTSSDSTGTSPASFRAVRFVSDRPRPAPVSTSSAPSACAFSATENAIDASVRTPVTRIFLPSSSPIWPPIAGERGTLPRVVPTTLRPVQIGILGGTGPAGKALAARLPSVGFEGLIGSRSKYRAMEIRDQLSTKWGGRALDIGAADNIGAAQCEVVVLATPWDGATETAMSVAAKLDGKVVICMANALARINNEFQPLVPPRGSVAASVQAACPGSLVAAALQHLPA